MAQQVTEARTETPHEARCRAAGITPEELDEQTHTLGRGIWYALAVLTVVAVVTGTWWALLPVAVLAYLNLMPARYDR